MKVDQLEFIINRFDHYSDSVNNKGQFFLGINTFIVSGLGASFLFIKEDINNHQSALIILLFLLALSFVSIGFTLMAILPFLKSNNKRSLIFFGSVSSFDNDSYVKKLKMSDQDRVFNDLASQAHYLACGLNKKYKLLQYAGWAITGQFALLIPFLILIFNLFNNNN